MERDNDDVFTIIEIAWSENRIRFLTVEQLEDKEKLEQIGWKIVDLLSLSEAVKMFEGEGR